MSQPKQLDPLTATVTGEASETRYKQSKNPNLKFQPEYVLHEVEITQDCPLKGTRVIAQRTTKNADGRVKSNVSVGQDILVYPTILVNNQNQQVALFEIRTLIATPQQVAGKLMEMALEQTNTMQPANSQI